MLTPEGAQLAAALDAAFSDIRRAVDELTGGDATRPLQITSTPAFTSSWLMPRLSEFRHEHPAIQLMLNPTTELVELKPGGIDVAIRYGSGDWRGLAGRAAGADHLRPGRRAVAPRRPRASSSPATSSTCPGCRSSAPARCRAGCATAA